MSREKILIIDDTPANIDLLSAALEPRGYEILAAPGGEAGLKIAAKALPDLILLDVVKAPGRDGFAICRELKADEVTREIPVLFITAKQETASVVNGFRVGGVDYILKPFQADEVVGRVETHLKISRLSRELLRKNTELEAEITRRRAAEAAREKADARFSTLSAREAQRWGLASFIGHSRLVRQDPRGYRTIATILPIPACSLPARAARARNSSPAPFTMAARARRRRLSP